jgi:hypothetical protein
MESVPYRGIRLIVKVFAVVTLPRWILEKRSAELGSGKPSVFDGPRKHHKTTSKSLSIGFNQP